MHDNALIQVIADAREEAAVLHRNGAAFSVERVSRLLDDVRDATKDYTTMLTEAEAMLKSGLSERTLRRRFRELLECNLACYGEHNARLYRSCAVPQRGDTVSQRERGRKSA